MTGTVYRSTGSWYSVKSGNTMYECRIKGKLRLAGIDSTNPVAVGDVVELEPEDEQHALIVDVVERKNYIVRKSINLSKRSHIIAANIDQACLIATLKHPDTSTGFMDRFLLTCEAYHIKAVLIFNKIDILSEKEMKELDGLIGVYESIGYPCLKVSAKTQEGVESFKSILKDKTSLLSGHSGVGKSTLINCIEPGLGLKVGEISSYHRKGQHTTTFAEMFDLEMGGRIIDTPGVKGFGILNFEKEEIAGYFPEMRALLPNCKFHNCVHINEPGCAVKEAVVNGDIAEFRYRNYLSMWDEDQDQSYRQNIYG